MKKQEAIVIALNNTTLFVVVTARPTEIRVRQNAME